MTRNQTDAHQHRKQQNSSICAIAFGGRTDATKQTRTSCHQVRSVRAARRWQGSTHPSHRQASGFASGLRNLPSSLQGECSTKPKDRKYPARPQATAQPRSGMTEVSISWRVIGHLRFQTLLHQTKSHKFHSKTKETHFFHSICM